MLLVSYRRFLMVTFAFKYMYFVERGLERQPRELLLNKKVNWLKSFLISSITVKQQHFKTKTGFSCLYLERGKNRKSDEQTHGVLLSLRPNLFSTCHLCWLSGWRRDITVSCSHTVHDCLLPPTGSLLCHIRPWKQTIPVQLLRDTTPPERSRYTVWVTHSKIFVCGLV